MTCGKSSHFNFDLNRLADLGRALELQQTLSVFCRGFVGFCDEDESEVMQHVKRSKRRSEARPWSGQRATERPRRAAGQDHYFRSEAAERAFGDQFRVLAQQYDALAFEDDDGLWVAVSSEPLGRCGPQVHFFIAFPYNRQLLPKGWAFKRIGSRAEPMSMKHTNFPDASICAFMPNEGAWSPNDGMLGLVDHYSIWAVKKLHRDYLKRWPGRQFGACALYRRMEFVADEQCGCLSGRLYRDCHMGPDLLVDEEYGRVEFRKLFRSDYETRAVPELIKRAAQSTWRKIPSIREVLELK